MNKEKLTTKKGETVNRKGKFIVGSQEVKKPPEKLEKMGNDHEDGQTVIEEIEIDQTEENDVGDQNEMPKKSISELLTVSGCLSNDWLMLQSDQGWIKCCICDCQVSLEKRPNELVFLLQDRNRRCCLMAWICLACWTKTVYLTHPWSVRVRNSDLALVDKDPIPDEGPTCPICRQKVQGMPFSKAVQL